MSPNPGADLERLRAICMRQPHAAEKVSHGAATFFIEKGKVFAYFTHNHHGDGRTGVLVKTSGIEEQEMLIEADPDLHYRPAYIGHKGWLGIRTDQPESDWDHIADRIETSWRLVAPKKLLERFA
jgi:phosphoribosylglycinamide formyltransferase-1/phosphoribosylamine--glycine ligase/phosphoribosylglycinamide formyltransferase/phosphoribosylformylglycinamidine cyclo-ligase